MISNLTTNPINKFKRKIGGNGAARAGKGFASFNSNKNMNDIIEIVNPLDDSGVFIDEITETVKYEIKK